MILSRTDVVKYRSEEYCNNFLLVSTARRQNRCQVLSSFHSGKLQGKKGSVKKNLRYKLFLLRR